MATRKLATPVSGPSPFPSSPLKLSASVVGERGLIRAALDAVAADPAVVAAGTVARTAEERAAHLSRCAALSRLTALAHYQNATSAPF